MGKRNVGYDFIRIFAIFLVVVIHANVAYLGKIKDKQVGMP
jgi:peptidoglycan/LPS O-acetylase OafA/YrhL